MKRLRLSQRGDTIVEVMIAAVVLTLIIGAAYSIASRSLKAGRQAQERSEALKIAEGQAETIKAKAASGSDPGIFTAANFCFDTSGTRTDTACTFSQLYRVSINSTPSDLTRQFNVSVEWDSIGGLGKEQIVINYRVLNEGS